MGEGAVRATRDPGVAAIDARAEGYGRPHGTSIELFVAGAVRLDRAVIERLLAA